MLRTNKLDNTLKNKWQGYRNSVSQLLRARIRAATVNRNIGYPRFRTPGSVSVRLSQISVRFRFVFFFTTKILLKQTFSFCLENLIKYGPVIIILLLSFKERENLAPSCKFKSSVWEHFDFLVAILLFFYVCRWNDVEMFAENRH